MVRKVVNVIVEKITENIHKRACMSSYIHLLSLPGEHVFSFICLFGVLGHFQHCKVISPRVVFIGISKQLPTFPRKVRCSNLRGRRLVCYHCTTVAPEYVFGDVCFYIYICVCLQNNSKVYDRF